MVDSAERCPECKSDKREVRGLVDIPPRNVGSVAAFGYQARCCHPWHDAPSVAADMSRHDQTDEWDAKHAPSVGASPKICALCQSPIGAERYNEGLSGVYAHADRSICKRVAVSSPVAPQCNNLNHALTDGSPSPHEIGASCMASSPVAEPPQRLKCPDCGEELEVENRTLGFCRNEKCVSVDLGIEVVTGSSPQGKWAKLMATVLPCGHTEAQHQYHPEHPMQPCPLFAGAVAEGQQDVSFVSESVDPPSCSACGGSITACSKCGLIAGGGSVERVAKLEKALTFDRFQQVNKHRCETKFHQCETWLPSGWPLAIAGEAGELCNLIKKVVRGDFSFDDKRGEILKELADVIIYCDLMITAMGAKTGEIVAAKFDEVSQRVGYSEALLSESARKEQG